MSLAPQKTQRAGRSRAGQIVAWASWLYVAVVLALWGLLWTASDAWWPATLLMYTPRWVWWIPLVPLGFAAAWFRPGMLEVLLIGAVVVLWPLMGLCIPWQRLFSEPPEEFRCRVLTCNVHRSVHGLRVALDEARPDVVALQDCPGQLDARLFGDDKWHVRNAGQFCLASRYPIREFTPLERPSAPPDAVVRSKLETPAGLIRFYNLHLATPRQALVAVRQRGWNGAAELEANSEERRFQSAAIRAWMAEEDGPLLGAGDFNTPPDSSLYRQFWSAYSNAFSEAGLGWGYTYHMNRAALRIDHVLAGPGWRCHDCWIGPDVGSEHLPVIADMEWRGLRQ